MMLRSELKQKCPTLAGKSAELPPEHAPAPGGLGEKLQGHSGNARRLQGESGVARRLQGDSGVRPGKTPRTLRNARRLQGESGVARRLLETPGRVLCRKTPRTLRNAPRLQESPGCPETPGRLRDATYSGRLPGHSGTPGDSRRVRVARRLLETPGYGLGRHSRDTPPSSRTLLGHSFPRILKKTPRRLRESQSVVGVSGVTEVSVECPGRKPKKTSGHSGRKKHSRDSPWRPECPGHSGR